jgi:N,N'-diacetyllegionaminate synthase
MNGTRVTVEGHPPLEDGRCVVMAEAGANHNNSVDRAIEMSEKAAAAGAWGIKFQLYKAESLSTRSAPKYWSDAIGTETQFEAFQLSDRMEYHEYAAIAEACADLGIVFFATPFDAAAVEALESMNAPIYKVASGDITHKPLLREIAATGKPIVLSTGAATAEEVSRAIDWLDLSPEKLVLLVCTLSYPTHDGDGHFARIETFRKRFEPHLIGVSDHTLGVAGGWVASALGAVCIEKHYTLDKSLPDIPDHKLSVDAEELEELVQGCDRGAVLRGSAEIRLRDSEMAACASARRSLVTGRDIDAGEVIEEEDLRFKRPGSGIPPFEVDAVVGRRATRKLAADQPIGPDDFQ